MAGFFEFFDIRLVAGRSLSAEDPDEAVVISRNLADALWPGVSDPIGRTFRIGSEPMVRQVVGVSRDVRTSLHDPRTDTPEFFHGFPSAVAPAEDPRADALKLLASVPSQLRPNSVASAV